MPTSLAPAISPRPRPPSGKYTRGLSLTDPNALGPHVSLGGDLLRKEDIRQQLSVVQLDLLRRQDRHRRAVDRAAWQELELLDLQSEPHTSVGRHRLAADQQTAAAGPMWVSSVGTGMTSLDNPKSPTGRHARANKQRVCRA